VNNAPERCIDCTLTTPSACNASTATEGRNLLEIYPGPSCPLVRLDEQAKLLLDPTAVLTMVLRGTVAKPDGMLFYEEWATKDAKLVEIERVARDAYSEATTYNEALSAIGRMLRMTEKLPAQEVKKGNHEKRKM
jgi:hypothetical protein